MKKYLNKVSDFSYRVFNRINESELVRVTKKFTFLEKCILADHIFFAIFLASPMLLVVLFWVWNTFYFSTKYKELNRDIEEKGQEAIIKDIKDKFEATVKEMSSNIADEYYKKIDLNK